MRARIAFGIAGLLPLMLSGCAGSSGAKPAGSGPSVNAGLNALAANEKPSTEELQRFIEQSAIDMEELKNAQAQRDRKLAQARLTQATLPETPPSPPETPAPEAQPEPPPVTPPNVGLNAQAKPPEPTTRDRVGALASELRKTLLEKNDDPESALPRYLALAMLEMLSASEQGIDPDAVALPSFDKLSDKERAALNSIRDLLESLARDPGAAGDPQKVSALFARSLEALANSQTVRITRAELCSRVEAFGRYTPFESHAFLAGEANRVIVYTEVDKYAFRELQGEKNARWSVELSQELQLYNADGSMLAWRRPEEPVQERSLNKRRDFFITQMIELPRTLTVGPYTLKVIVRDKVGGGVSEAVVAVNIVADKAIVAAGDARSQ
ncbi:MAG: hypothetical protein U0573_00915 [Phycisphaerales bacterium]|nr:hypothetical protein [Planctomycetota bacterium]